MAKDIGQSKTQKWISTGEKPKWYKILNSVFTETNEDLEITGNSTDVSFSLNEGDDESGISETEPSQESDSSGVNNEDTSGDEETPCSSKALTKLEVTPHKNLRLLDHKIKL